MSADTSTTHPLLSMLPLLALGAATDALKSVGVALDDIAGDGPQDAQSDTTEPPRVAPPVTSVVIYDHTMTAHMFPTGRTWDREDDGTLVIEDEFERVIAEFAPGSWTVAKDVFGAFDA